MIWRGGKLAESIGTTQAAHDLGIDRSLISAWKKLLATEGANAFRGKGRPTEEQSELVGMRRNVHSSGSPEKTALRRFEWV
jgi:hypothetical protein